MLRSNTLIQSTSFKISFVFVSHIILEFREEERTFSICKQMTRMRCTFCVSNRMFYDKLHQTVNKQPATYAADLPASRWDCLSCSIDLSLSSP